MIVSVVSVCACMNQGIICCIACSYKHRQSCEAWSCRISCQTYSYWNSLSPWLMWLWEQVINTSTHFKIVVLGQRTDLDERMDTPGKRLRELQVIYEPECTPEQENSRQTSNNEEHEVHVFFSVPCTFFHTCRQQWKTKPPACYRHNDT